MSRSEVVRTASRHNSRMARSVVSMSMVSNSSKGTELLPTRTGRKGETTSVPYRLPKLSQPCVLTNRAEIQVHDGKNKIWSRVGYNSPNSNSEDVDALVWKIYVPPKSFVQQMRQTNLALPQFRDAVIAPSLQTHDFHDLLNYKRLLTEKTTEVAAPKTCPPTTPVSRSQSGRKSGQRLHWTLGPNRHASFDKKGQGRAQGPYSREFTITCMPPNNWLKMKLGRIPTMAVGIRGY